MTLEREESRRTSRRLRAVLRGLLAALAGGLTAVFLLGYLHGARGYAVVATVPYPAPPGAYRPPARAYVLQGPAYDALVKRFGSSSLFLMRQDGTVAVSRRDRGRALRLFIGEEAALLGALACLWALTGLLGPRNEARAP